MRLVCPSWFPVVVVAVLPALLLVSSGCKTDPGARREIALLRAEIIDVEDKYARLKSRYEQTAMELSAATGQPVDMTFPESDYSVVIEDDSMGQPIVIDEQIIYDEPYSVDEVMVDPVPEGAGNQAPEAELRGPQNLPQAKPNPAQPAGEAELPLPEGNLGDGVGRLRPGQRRFGNRIAAIRSGVFRRNASPITEILINRNATRGVNLDGQLGDEGLDLLVQPRLANGRVALEAGELTVSIVDPKAARGSRQIGSWKLLPEETELFFVNDELESHGILLHLPWEQVTPTRSRLIVTVRFVSSDGTVLTTSSDVRIKPPSRDYSPADPAIIAWSQNDSRWADEPMVDQSRRSKSPARGIDAELTNEPGSPLKRNPPLSGFGSARVPDDQPRWRPVR